MGEELPFLRRRIALAFFIVIFCEVLLSDALGLASLQRETSHISSARTHSSGTLRLKASLSNDQANPSKQNRKSDRQRSDDKTYHTNLKLAKLANQSSGQQSASQARLALKLLRSMEAPDTVAYNSVLKAFAKLSPVPLEGSNRFSAALQARVLLQEMGQVHEKQKLANQNWYAALTQGLLDDEMVSQGPPAVLVKPNIRSYCTVMDAYARIGSAVAAEKTEELLHELQNLYETIGDEALQPNLIAYNILLAAWSKVGGPGAADRCLALLREEMPLTPDTISYNSALHAIALSGEANAGDRAEALLREMLEKTDTGLVNGRSYTTCMDAWSKIGRADKAQSLLVEMKDIYKRTKDESFRPNCVSYATVIHGYALSKDPEKAQKAYRIFREMIEDGVNPNRITYNKLLNCCATSTTNPELVQLVKSLYYEVRDQKKADHRTFGTVLKACSNLFWEDTDFTEAVFQEACLRGQVSEGVFWQFKQSVSMDTFRQVTGGNALNYADLPTEWTQNVKQD